jgi:hypothetical protein
VLGRRLIILVAVLMGLTALAATVAPPPESQRRGARETPSPSPAPTTPGDPGELALTVDAAERPQQVQAAVGDSIGLEVRAELIDTVVIDGLDAVEAVEPDSPARFELFADAPGRYPIRLLDADRQLGELVISSVR